MNEKLKKKLGKYLIIAIIVIVVPIIISGCTADTAKQTPLPPTKQRPIINPATYEIVETTKRGGAGDKEFIYRVVLASDIKAKQVRPTIEKIISDITVQDNDIDEISLFLYSDKGLVNGAYDIGSATWAPGGKLGNLTPKITQKNDRSSYRITIDVKDNLDEYLSKRNEKEEKFGMSEDERRQFFKDVCAAESKATGEAEAKYPPNNDEAIYWKGNNFLLDKWDTAFKNFMKLEDVLLEKYRKQVLDKNGITKEQYGEIQTEAFSEGWPLK